MRAGRARSEVGPGEPVWAFPSVLDAEAGPLRGEPIMQRGLPETAARLELAVWPRHLIVQPQHLRHTFAEKDPAVGPRAETADVHRPEVQRRLPFDNPFREIFSRAAGARDTDGVEAGGDK